MSKAKVIMVGPSAAGKTFLSNFLADATEFSSGDYHPTQGVRIIEFEAGSDTGRASVDVELWDCSGDRKFENFWPVFVKDASGAIFVYNPDQPNHDKELDAWYNFIIGNEHIKESQCYVFAHHKPNTAGESCQLSNSFTKIPLLHTSLQEDSAEKVRREFNKFLSSLVKAVSSNREQEELNIMNQ